MSLLDFVIIKVFFILYLRSLFRAILVIKMGSSYVCSLVGGVLITDIRGRAISDRAALKLTLLWSVNAGKAFLSSYFSLRAGLI